jgi:serine/threonine protein kinase
MIIFLCSHCGVQLRVRPDQAGLVGRCPRCGKVVEAPRDGAPGDSGGKIRQSTGRTPLPAAGTARDAFEAVAGAREEELSFLAPPQGPGELGRIAHYRVLKVLGAGGMGIVFEAEDVNLQRSVALKVMKKAQAANQVNRERFLREARAAAKIEHDHIVTIYQVDEDRGVPFIAMKLLVGESLEDRLNREGKLSFDEIIRIGQETALGLAEAHEKGLIHRDIKPANIWLEEGRGRVKLVDFGLARANDEDTRLTGENFMVGTPMYMSPEQAEGDREIDARSDLFSLGGVLYRMSTGELPFKGRNTMQVLNALATKVPPPPIELNPELPGALSKLIMSLLSKDPEQRPRTARVVVAALEEIRDAPAGYEEVEEEAEEVVEDVEPVEQALDTRNLPEPRRSRVRKPPRRPPRRREVDPEERLARRVIVFGIIAGILVFLLLAFMVIRDIWKRKQQEHPANAGVSLARAATAPLAVSRRTPTIARGLLTPDPFRSRSAPSASPHG